MIYYFLLATIGMACVIFGFNVYLPAMNYIANPNKPVIVISFLYMMICFFVTKALKDKKKTIKFKDESVTLTYEDKMFIDLIRKNDYKVNQKDEKIFENKGKFFAEFISFCLTLVTFINIIKFLNIKINFNTINKDILFLFLMGFISFVSMGNLIGAKSRKHNVLLPYYIEYIKLDTAYEYSHKFLKDKMSKKQYNEYKNNITEGLDDKIKKLIEIDKNTDYFKKFWLFS